MKRGFRVGAALALACVLCLALVSCRNYEIPASISLEFDGAQKLGENEYQMTVGKTAYMRMVLPPLATDNLRYHMKDSPTFTMDKDGILTAHRGDTTFENSIEAVGPGVVKVRCVTTFLNRNSQPVPFTFDLIFHVVDENGQIPEPVSESEPVSFTLGYTPKQPKVGMRVQAKAEGVTGEQAALGSWSVLYTDLASGAALPDAGSPIGKDGAFMAYQPCAAKVTFRYQDVEKSIVIRIEGEDNFTLSLTPDALKLTVGAQGTLTPTFRWADPSLSTAYQGVWESDNLSVATVDQNGKVTAVAPGTARVCFKLGKFHEAGSYRQACAQVVVPAQPISGYTKPHLSMGPQETQRTTETPAPTQSFLTAPTPTPIPTFPVVIRTPTPAPSSTPSPTSTQLPTPTPSRVPTPSPSLPSVPVTNITGVPAYVIEGQTIQLQGTVHPSNASYKTIQWSIVSGQGYKAELNGNRLTGMEASTPDNHPVIRATIRNGNAGGSDYTQDFEIEVRYDVDLQPGMLPDGTQGLPYNVELEATNGGGGPYTFALQTGSLPGGLTLSPDPNDGGKARITGTVDAHAEVKTYRFTIRVADKDGNTQDFDYTLTVQATGSPTSL